MKRILTLSSILSVASLVAQPTIQYSDVATGSSSHTIYVLTDAGSAVEPSAGANQTWDFSTVQFAAVGTAVLGPASDTPYGASYPAADVAWAEIPTVGAADYEYLSLSTTGMENVVSNVPSAPNPYSDPQRIMQFPFVFGTSFTDTYASPAHSGTDTWTYEGHGTLITPVGTFTNQLKLKNDDGDFVIWNASPLFPRLIANSSGATLFGSDITGVGEIASAPVSVFPIPATTSLNIDGISGAAQWAIMDLQGRVVRSGSISGGSRSTLDIASLEEGEYLLSIQGSVIRRVVRFLKQ